MVINPIMVDNFASLFNCTMCSGSQTKWRLPPQSVSEEWYLTINVCDRAHHSPVCGFLVLWLQIAIEYSWLSLSQPRLSRITAYLKVKIWSLPKHENLTTGNKYYGKEEKLLLKSNFSSFPQYFQCISNFKSPITYIFRKSLLTNVCQ